MRKRIKKKIKKSQILIFGSFLVFVGVVLVSSNYLIKIRNEVFNEMIIKMMNVNVKEEIEEVPEVENVEEEKPTENNNVTTNNNNNSSNKNNYVINYDKYYGVLEIPRISLKRGFYNLGNRYNNIEYNVTMVEGSSMPDVTNGNLILMAHSGDAYISYFENLYKLAVGDMAYITHKGTKYSYKIVNIYNVEKNGRVTIYRNYDKTTLTLITCTKNNDASQTVYIAELV